MWTLPALGLAANTDANTPGWDRDRLQVPEPPNSRPVRVWLSAVREERRVGVVLCATPTAVGTLLAVSLTSAQAHQRVADEHVQSRT